ncbi:MAG: polysaccharide deacetylase family protein [Calditrichaceae bacterium]|nr:polysaccharide deacetylase family protein [Calditrichaceae bacterium]RQV92463.1 MAG: polysaccharide deacetylase family protein [Calditrichota bacterium]
MAAKKEDCKNHTGRKTAKRCYYCHQPICPECQHIWTHHLFCSIRCYLLWRIKETFMPVIKKPEFIFLIIFVFLLQVITYFILSSQIDTAYDNKTNQIRAGNETPAEIMPEDLNIMIDSVRYNLTYQLGIRISPEKEAVYGIWKDDAFINAVAGSNNETTRFDYTLGAGRNHFSVWRMDKTGHGTLMDSFTVVLKSLRKDILNKSLRQFYMRDKVVALTFDGGSSDRGTEKLLNMLDSLNIKSTIFLTGHFIKYYPDLAKRIVLAGHEVGNHSYSHPHLTSFEKDGLHNSLSYVNRALIHKQLLKTDSIFFLITGKKMSPLWRAPYGELNNDILSWAAELGYLHVGWSAKCDSWDWVKDESSTLYRNNADMLSHFLDLEEKHGLNGRIILMHLASERDGPMPYQILPELVKNLRNRGYIFEKIGKMLRAYRDVNIYSNR